MGYRIAAVAAVLLATAVCAVRVGNAQHLDLPVEHAFGGGPFSRAGRLSGDLDSEGGATLQLQREPWTPAEKDAFATTASQDGFYRVRVTAPGAAAAVLASVRARCLQAAGFQEQLVLHVGADGSPYSLDYTAATRECRVGMPVARGAGDAAPPEAVPVVVAAPTAAHRVSLEPLDPVTAAATAQPQPPWLLGQKQGELLEQYHRQRQAALAATGASAASPEGASAPITKQEFMKGKDGRPVLDKDGNPVPVPEKTWIQQNWYFLIPVGMVIFNALGQLLPAAPTS
mmetsp:Transcript_16934/g.50566  ORF Transcript_16934/g.50566 Transcript_16934/m.50566 type:complete len:286 (-) Transcript_16934:214-1071(-)